MQTKSLFFRSNKVRRIYDQTSNSLIYVSYRCVPGIVWSDSCQSLNEPALAIILLRCFCIKHYFLFPYRDAISSSEYVHGHGAHRQSNYA